MSGTAAHLEGIDMKRFWIATTLAATIALSSCSLATADESEAPAPGVAVKQSTSEAPAPAGTPVALGGCFYGDCDAHASPSDLVVRHRERTVVRAAAGPTCGPVCRYRDRVPLRRLFRRVTLRGC